MILTNLSSFIEVNDNLIERDNNFIDINIPSNWINHCNVCIECNSFYNRIKTISKDDWFIKDTNEIWFKLNFLNLNQIGNGNYTFLSGQKIGWFLLDDIELLNVSSQELKSLNRTFKLDCLGI